MANQSVGSLCFKPTVNLQRQYLQQLCFIFQLKYSSILDDLQKDTDEEELSEKESNNELPVQVDTHFKKFNIKFRKAESKEEIKQAISTLEKEALLLNLIPIAFNEDLESKT